MKILKSSIVVAFCVLISRMSGLARDLFIASLFGVSATSDSLQVALRLPTAALYAIILRSIPSVFVPTFTNKVIESKEDAQQFASNIFSIIITFSTALIIASQLLMPYIIFILAPGFYASDQLELTVMLCRITICSIIFSFLSAFFGEILNALSNFYSNALGPSYLNLSMIICTYFLSKLMSLEYAVCSAFTCGVLIQLLFVYINLLRTNIRLSLSFSWWNNSLKIFYKKFLNSMLNFSISQVNVMVYYAIASFIPGAITILVIADKLCFLPLSVISLGFNTTLLTELSKLYKNKLINDANILINQTIKACCFLILPAATGLAVLSYQIVALIYQHGAVKAEDSNKIALVVTILTVGLPAFALYKILAVMLYANHNVRIMVRITILNVTINILLNILLTIKLSYLGLVISPIIASWIALILLYIYAQKYNHYSFSWSMFNFIVKVLIACLVMAMTVSLIVDQGLYGSSSMIKQAGLLSSYIIIGVIIYLIMCYILKIFDLQILKPIFLSARKK